MLLGNKSHTVEQPVQQFHKMGMLETGYNVYIPRRWRHKDSFPHSVTLHGAAGRSGWCRQHAHWNLNIRQLNHRVKVWKRCGERYADSCNSGGIAVISTFMFLSQDCNKEKSHLNAMIHKSFARVSNMFQVFCLLCISIKSIFQSSHNLTVTNEVWLLCSCERHLSHVSGWVCDSA